MLRRVHHLPRIACALGLGLLAPLVEAGTAEVRFDQPEHYSDARRTPQSPRPDRSVLDAVERQFQDLARERLPDAQHLEITVSDIDLAGEWDPFFLRGGANEVRVLRPVGWPRIELRYTLSEQGQELRAGEGTISDLDYMNRLAIRRSGEPLASEKDMIDRWFKEQFGTGG